MKISYLFKNLAKKINDAKVYTDAQMEAGTDYIKFANGVLIQWGGVSVTVSNIGHGESNVTFTVAFIAIPIITVSCSTDNPYRQMVSTVNEATTGFTAHMYNGTSGGETKTVNWIAIGKWK